MINKNYWDDFYLNNNLTKNQSRFAEYVLNYIKEQGLNGHLIDVACGNGRDSFFFKEGGLEITAIDLSSKLENVDFFIKTNLLKHDYSKYDFIYLRFVIHSLSEKEFDELISILRKNKNAIIFIETRSTKEVTDEIKSETFFKSSIGEEHFRMLYSKDYLDKKLSKFNIIESSEGKYSKFGSDNPYCIRYILKN